MALRARAWADRIARTRLDQCLSPAFKLGNYPGLADGYVATIAADCAAERPHIAIRRGPFAIVLGSTHRSAQGSV